MAERLTGWWLAKMERATSSCASRNIARDKAHAYILRCFGEHEGGDGRECPHMGTNKCDLCRYMIAVVDKLARFEDERDG